MPVRNAGGVLKKTVASLLAQTDKRFSVLISDNYSSKGVEELEEAERLLKGSGIVVTRVKPPRELKRVAHWNWAHSQSTAEWIKPLFVGDFLEATYVEKVLARAGRTKSNLIRCEFQWVTPTFVNTAPAPTKALHLSSAEYLEFFPQLGNWMGSPISVCYRRTAFLGAGGYAVHLPACADYNLYIRLTLEAGVEIIHESLATLQIHEERFSHGITKRRVNGCFELWLMLRQAKIYCANNKLPWPKYGVAKGLWKQYRMDYYYPWKKRVKNRLLGRS